MSSSFTRTLSNVICSIPKSNKAGMFHRNIYLMQ